MRTFSKGKFFTERNLTNGLTHGAPFSGVHRLHLSHEPALLDSSVPYLSLIDPACAITNNASNMVSTSSLAYSHMAPCKGCSCSIPKTWDLSMHSLEVSHASSEMSSIHPSFSPRSGQACFYVTNAHGRAVLDFVDLINHLLAADPHRFTSLSPPIQNPRYSMTPQLPASTIFR